MAQALSTQGQGGAHIALTSVANTSGQSWVIGGTFIVHDLSANAQLAGANNSTQNVLRVYPDGRLAMRSAATDRISSAAGAIQANVPFPWKIINNTTTGNWELYVNDMGTAVGTFARGSTAWAVNQLARFSTSATSEITVRDFYCSGSTYNATWDETTAPGTGTAWLDTTATRALTITGATGATDSWWVNYGGVTQHQSTSGIALQVFTAIADTVAINKQHPQTSGSAEQACSAIAATTHINAQQHQTTGSAEQVFTATGKTTASNKQHRQSSGQVVSVAGFIASTSWVNTVETSNVQHHQTSGSASQVFSAVADTVPVNNQKLQTSGTASQVFSATAQTTASNKQHRQSSGQALSVAGFIASTSWVNTIDTSNVQHRQTSGSAAQTFRAQGQSSATNKQNRQSSGRASAVLTAVASTSYVNNVLQISAYTRHIKTRSISKKNYQTSTRHSYHIKSSSNHIIELTTQSGGVYMQDINFKQGASALLVIDHNIDNAPVTGISAAKYELYGRTGQVLIEKTLGEGIVFTDGIIEISLSDEDTADLSGSYNHQCVAKDIADRTFFPLNGDITFGATKPRL